MSQLSGLNQTQQTQSSAQVPDLQATKSNIAKAEVMVANNLQGTFRLHGMAAPVTQQLTMAQASQLAQHTLLSILNQQTALVFLQFQQSSTSLNIPPALLSMTQEWLKTDKTLTNKLPKELATFLATNLGLKTGQLQNQLLLAALKQNLLQLSFFQGDAIAELKWNVAATPVAGEQIEQLLQMMLPISMGDDASVLIQQQATNRADDDDNDILRFRLQFDLNKLGKLEVQIELKEFELSSICLCDSPLLQQKVKRYWPKLEARLNSLGFDMSNQIKLKTKLDDNTPQTRSSSLINVKV